MSEATIITINMPGHGARFQTGMSTEDIKMEDMRRYILNQASTASDIINKISTAFHSRP